MRKGSISIVIALFYTGLAAAASAPAPAPAPTAAPVNATQAQAEAAKAQNENAIISQVQTAQSAKDWPKADSLLTQLTAMDPGNWQYQQALGDVRLNEGKYAEAAQAYAGALAVAAKAEVTPALHQAMAAMYSNQGNAYQKLKKDDQAFKAYTQAAQLSDGAAAATAWFIKGSILMGDSDEDANGKPLPPPGTVEAFKKYLSLEPHGPHAGEAQQ